MLTGTADPIVSGPTKEIIFLEDLPPEEQVSHSTSHTYILNTFLNYIFIS
jgi:hypothetical protein